MYDWCPGGGDECKSPKAACRRPAAGRKNFHTASVGFAILGVVQVLWTKGAKRESALEDSALELYSMLK